MDTKTIIILGFLFMVLYLILFSYYLVSNGFKKDLLGVYTIGRLSFLFTTCLYIFAPKLTPIVMSLSALGAFTGLCIEAYCLTYLNKETSNKRLYNFIIYSLIWSLIYAIFSKEVSLRVIIASIYYISIFVFVFYRNSIKKGSTRVQHFIGILSFLFVLVNIDRGITSYFGENPITI